MDKNDSNENGESSKTPEEIIQEIMAEDAGKEVDLDEKKRMRKVETPKEMYDAIQASYDKSVKFQVMKEETAEISVAERHEKALARKKYKESFEKINVDYVPPKERLVGRIQENLKFRKKNFPFLAPSFRFEVPQFPSQLILFGARSGAGKSSACLAITQNSLMHKKKVLVILNEEDTKDFYLRLACYLENKNYAHSGELDEKEESVLMARVDKAVAIGDLKVIDDTYFGEKGATTSKEGLEKILESLMKSESKYDQIIIDYFQKFANSQNNNESKPFLILREVAHMLDSFKNKYPAAIILFSQLHIPVQLTGHSVTN